MKIMAQPTILMASAGFLPDPLPQAWSRLRHGCLTRAEGRCFLCDEPSGDRLDVAFLDGETTNWTEENLVAACPLCRLPQALNLPRADDEMLPVWLPEIDQHRLDVLVRSIHRGLVARGHAPFINRRTLPREDNPRIRHWIVTYLALVDRARRLGAMLGGMPPTPSQLARLFRKADPDHGICPVKLRPGLRFVSLGRYYEGDRDIYTELVACPYIPPLSIPPRRAA